MRPQSSNLIVIAARFRQRIGIVRSLCITNKFKIRTTAESAVYTVADCLIYRSPRKKYTAFVIYNDLEGLWAFRT